MLDERDQIDGQIAQLADGSLPVGERERLHARVRAEGRIGELEDQRRIAILLRAADEPAPAALHRGVAEMLAPRRRRRERGRLRLAGGTLATLAAAAAAAIVLVVTSAGSAPDVAAAAQLALRRPNAAAPAADLGDPGRLSTAVDGVHFPTWRGYDWKPVGSSSQQRDGQRLLTVTYRGPSGQRIGYLIASGRPLPASGGKTVVLAGTTYREIRSAGTDILTWVEHGHTCLMASRDTTTATLLALAASRRSAS